MDPLGHDAIEAILRLLEVELGKEREKTRVTEEWLRADRAAVEAKEKERSMLVRERGRMLAVKQTEDRLVAEFLEADDNGDFEAQNALMEKIVALMSRDRDSGDGSNAGGSGSVNGGNFNYLENTQKQDEGAVTATIEGKNGGAE